MFFRSNKPNLSEFAQSLAEDIAKRYPPELDVTPSKRPSVNRLTRIIEDVCQQVVVFQRTHQLGWYRKSKLANNFKWALRDRGYSRAFIDFATEAVVVHLSKQA